MAEIDCAICDIPADRVLDEGPQTVTALFHNPQVPGHVIVASKEHKRFPNELSQETNAELGRAVAAAFQRAAQLTGSERCYVAVVGDRDLHFHYHVLPIQAGMPPLGPYLFGGDGWASTSDKSKIEGVNRLLAEQWRL